MRPLFFALLLLASGCDGGTSETDGGGSSMDGGRRDGGTTTRDGGGGDVDGGCARAVEICGDRMDQNCDGRDTSCGDSDGDMVQACRPGEAPPACDCDDAHAEAYPARAGLAGAQEACDGLDNDCDGRFDEAAECCAACMALDDFRRGDECTTSGACDCSTEPGEGPCPAGQRCCSMGCVDVQSDEMNCGFCNTPCTRCMGSDTCMSGTCGCGSGGPCDFTDECVDGTCQPRTAACE